MSSRQVRTLGATADRPAGQVFIFRILAGAGVRLGLVALFGVAAVYGVFMAITVHQTHQRRSTVHTIWSLGGYIKRQANVPILKTGWASMVDQLSGAETEQPVRLVRLAGTDASDSHVKMLGTLSRQRMLDLRDTRVTDAGLKYLRPLSDLRVLILTGTSIGDDGVKQLSQMPHLQVLCLEETAVTDESLEQLKHLTNLEWLNLSGTRITDGGLAQLREFPTLRVIVLEGCSVSETALAELQQAVLGLLVFNGNTRRPFLSFLSATTN